MLAGHPELCAALAAEDFFVVRFDNRDGGLSTHLHDEVSLLDALGLDRLSRATTDTPRGGGGVDRGISEDHLLPRLPDGRGLGPRSRRAVLRPQCRVSG
ncbi:MAG: hypothetical protein ACRDQX_06455 [Pseudonocardiaceae bacterium]